MMRAIIFLFALACASENYQKGVRTPKGWTLDRNAQHADPLCCPQSAAETQQFKILQSEYLEEGNDGTTETVLAPEDNLDAITQLVEKMNTDIAVNKKFWLSLLEAEDNSCFSRREFRELKVRVQTKISPYRNTDSTPEISFDMGIEGIKGKTEILPQDANVVDGGATVFKYEFSKFRTVSMDDIQKIHVTLVRESDDSETDDKYYFETEEKFGDGICTDNNWYRLGFCAKKEEQDAIYFHEADLVTIEKIDMFAKYPFDPKSYHIYSSLSSPQKPLITLNGTIREYSVFSFRNNPFWALHYYSAKCDTWDEPYNDGSVFAADIKKDFIDTLQPIGSDAMRKAQVCEDKKMMDVYALPPYLILTHPQKKSNKDIWVNDAGMSSPTRAAGNICNPLTIEDLTKEVTSGDMQAFLGDEYLNKYDTSKKRSPELLQEQRDYLEKAAARLEGSNIGLKTDWNKKMQLGCFYDKKLTEGIHMEVHGQVLQEFGHLLMTEEAFLEVETKMGFNSPNPPEGNDKVLQMHISFGFSDKPFLAFNPVGNDTDANTYHFVKYIYVPPEYTKNFKLRDMTYVHVSRNYEDAFFQQVEGGEITKVSGFTFAGIESKTKLNTRSTSIEYNALNITYLKLWLGKKEDKKIIYEVGTENIDSIPNKLGVFNGLFVLNNTVRSWTDYGLKDNKSWDEFRKEQDICDEE